MQDGRYQYISCYKDPLGHYVIIEVAADIDLANLKHVNIFIKNLSDFFCKCKDISRLEVAATEYEQIDITTGSCFTSGIRTEDIDLVYALFLCNRCNLLLYIV